MRYERMDRHGCVAIAIEVFRRVEVGAIAVEVDSPPPYGV
jgi:hypothetical protein